MRRSFWKKIWEPEDSHLFGELALVVSAVLIAKGLEGILPASIGITIYFAIGFLFALWGVKLLRKSR